LAASQPVNDRGGKPDGGTLVANFRGSMTRPHGTGSTPAGAVKRRRGWRDWVASLMLAAGALAIALGLGEGLVRLLAPQQLILLRSDVWQPIDSLGWIHRPNLNTTINTGERSVRLITDDDGFRVGTARRVESARRVLLLGDSFMAALQVEYDQSVAGLLEARLSQRFNQTVAVRNAAVDGWDPPHYLIKARQMLERERFDLAVVAVYLGNDIVALHPTRYPPRAPVTVHDLRVPRRLSWREFIDAVLYPINDFLEVRSQLFILAKTRLNAVLARLGLTAEHFPVALLRREATSPRWTVTAQILSDIRGVARAHGVPTLFVLIPAPYQVDTAEFQRSLSAFRIDPAAVDLDQPNHLLTAAMLRHGLALFDVTPDFRHLQQAGERLYGKVDNHLSRAGHALLERLVEPLVVAHLEAPTLASHRSGAR
jgi:hypothetical protein